MKSQASKYAKFMLPVVVALGLAGCEATSSIEANRINLHTYEPLIDVEGGGHDRNQYYTDLNQCRQLALRLQARYEERRRDEQNRARQSALTGALAGAVIGNLAADAQNTSRNSGTAVGALYGGAIGAAVGEEQIDTDRRLARFGPTILFDDCMVDRGYKVHGQEQLGTRVR